MFKIGNIKTSESNSSLHQIANLFEGMKFTVNIKNTNSKQLNSNIDKEVIKTLSQKYTVTTSKKELLVEVDGVKVGELDIMFNDEKNNTYYMEIEKSNKKTLWFDYIKILTILKLNQNGRGIVMCPSNYAHSAGVWNIYKEAVIYKNHLKRVFGDSALNRVSVIGYTQYVFLDNKWQEFDSTIIKQIKLTTNRNHRSV